MATSATAVLTPDPGCVLLGFDENECTCRSTLVVNNGCEVPLEAIDFEWCGFHGDPYCTPEVEVGGAGELFLPRDGADAEGDHEIDLPVRLGDDELTLTLTYDMEEVTSRGRLGCSIVGPDAGSETPFAGLLVVALLSLARPQASKQRPRPPR